MLKKAKAQMESGGSQATKDMPQGVLDSSHKIWLAGLGAFSRAQREGAKMFDALVKQGEELQSRTRQAATDTAAAARGVAAAKAKEMQEMAGGTWDKLEQVFEDRVARALSKLGVYTQNDVQRLAARVDQLAAAVNKLVASSGGKSAYRLENRPQSRSALHARAARRNRPLGRRREDSSEVGSARPSAARRSVAVQPLDLLDVILHRLVLAHSFELGPGVVLGAADEVEAARAFAFHVAVDRLLVVRIELQQRRVIGLLLRLLGGGSRCFELSLEVILLRGSHRSLLLGPFLPRRSLCYFSAKHQARPISHSGLGLNMSSRATFTRSSPLLR
jgi:poly(hydroxyalkanoate) granule-associated protein